ncbi:MAG: hypothetical protein ACE5LG_01200 [Anaerolineae bacterium]
MKALRKLGYEADECAQEHSYLSIMWREVSQSAFLIYLDAFLSTIAQRLESHWEGEDLEEEWDRLHDARQHCDLTCKRTGSLQEVLDRVRRLLEASLWEGPFKGI